jgi:hypothetical protein
MQILISFMNNVMLILQFNLKSYPYISIKKEF